MLSVDIIEINDDQTYRAKLVASSFSHPQSRKRGMIDMLGISCAINYLHAKKVKVNTKKSVYKIPNLFEEFKITDIYYGNYRIDVITLYKEKTIKIPKIHYDMDIAPHFYFVVQIGAKIKEAKMVGFIDAKIVGACSHDSKYYYPTLDMIFDLKKFQSIVKRSVPTKTLLGKHVDCLSLFLKFIDNDLSTIYKKQLIQHLMNCDSCRTRFIDAVEFEKLANNIKHYPNLTRKYEGKMDIADVAVYDNEGSVFADLENDVNEKMQAISEDEILENEAQENQETTDEQKAKLQKRKAAEKILAKKNFKKASNKVIDAIFDDMPKIELSSLKTMVKTKKKRLFLITVLIFATLSVFALISYKGTTSIVKENEIIENLGENFEEGYGENYNNNYNETIDNILDNYNLPRVNNRQAKLISKNSKNAKNIDMEDYLSKNVISTKPVYAPTVTKVSWEVPESISKKEAYVRFLQLTGKNVKLNLQNDLLLVNDIPMNKMAKIDIRIAANGDVVSSKLTQSSGSEIIDTSIKKVLDDTLSYMKPPAHGVIARPVEITLTLDLN